MLKRKGIWASLKNRYINTECIEKKIIKYYQIAWARDELQSRVEIQV